VIKWQSLKLGEVLQFQRGFDLLAKDRHQGDVPVVSSSGITGYHNSAKAKSPGVIIGRKGTLGTVHYIGVDYWPHDTTLWVKDFKGNSPRFIYYFLQLMNLESYDVGASNPTLNRNHIHKLSLEFPPLPIQKKIAAVLSAYDDLIENNDRRITLLEKMAEEIYREWFVRLRFPGHEQIRRYL
jgi:type I restriction enzyme, S subunit